MVMSLRTDLNMEKKLSLGQKSCNIINSAVLIILVGHKSLLSCVGGGEYTIGEVLGTLQIFLL